MKPIVFGAALLASLALGIARGPGAVAGEALSLEKAITVALENNFAILSSDEAIQGAEHLRKSAAADFLPKLTADGSFTHLDEKVGSSSSGLPSIPVTTTGRPPPAGAIVGFTIPIPGGRRSVDVEQDGWSIRGSLVQPVFTGGALLNRYRLAKIGVESARTARERLNQDISLQVVRAYFEVLNTMEQRKVADQAVKLLENQRDVSQEFFNVGMIPKNDLLRTEVQLAERVRAQTIASNAIEAAKAQLNLALQRPVQTSVELEDILAYKPVEVELDRAIAEALDRRLEIKEAALKVSASERQVDLARSAYFPQIQVSLNAFKGDGTVSSLEVEGWSFAAGATWNVFEWGKTNEDVAAARSQSRRDQYALLQLRDEIAVEVKNSYLALITAERNMITSRKAIEQAEEGFRMNQERYKEQVGTITEVLDAETQLAQARSDYYSALSNFNIAKAALNRAMGRRVYEM
jgi:outer membrane protein